jgi:hypothetical protein
MTEQDAKRVIQALGGNINAMTNPTLVAAALIPLLRCLKL